MIKMELRVVKTSGAGNSRRVFITDDYKPLIPVLALSSSSFLALNFGALIVSHVKESIKKYGGEFSEVEVNLREEFSALWRAVRGFSMFEKEKTVEKLAEELARRLNDVFTQVKNKHLQMTELGLLLDEKVFFPTTSGVKKGGIVRLEFAVEKIPHNYFKKPLLIADKLTDYLNNEEKEKYKSYIDSLYQRLENISVNIFRPEEPIITARDNYAESEELLDLLWLAELLDTKLRKRMSEFYKREKREALKEYKGEARLVLQALDKTVNALRMNMIEAIFSNKNALRALDMFLKHGRAVGGKTQLGVLKKYLILELLLNGKTIFANNILEMRDDRIFTDGKLVAFGHKPHAFFVNSYFGKRIKSKAEVGFLVFGKAKEEGWIRFGLHYVELELLKTDDGTLNLLDRVANAILLTARLENGELNVFVPKHYSYFGDAEVRSGEDLWRFNTISGKKFKVLHLRKVKPEFVIKQHFSSVEELKEFLEDRKRFKTEIVRALRRYAD